MWVISILGCFCFHFWLVLLSGILKATPKARSNLSFLKDFTGPVPETDHFFSRCQLLSRIWQAWLWFNDAFDSLWEQSHFFPWGILCSRQVFVQEPSLRGTHSSSQQTMLDLLDIGRRQGWPGAEARGDRIPRNPRTHCLLSPAMSFPPMQECVGSSRTVKWSQMGMAII